MEISKKTDYALRMIAELVCNPDRIVSVRTVSQDNGIPYSFARAIQHDLTVSGIVESVRGAHGGMRLAVDPRQTTLLSVIEAVQGTMLFVGCDASDCDDSECSFCGSCEYKSVWLNASRIMRAYFGAVTLHDIVIGGLMPDIDASFTLVPSRG